jgi:hypothetical protein
MAANRGAGSGAFIVIRLKVRFYLSVFDAIKSKKVQKLQKSTEITGIGSTS